MDIIGCGIMNKKYKKITLKIILGILCIVVFSFLYNSVQVITLYRGLKDLNYNDLKGVKNYVLKNGKLYEPVDIEDKTKIKNIYLLGFSRGYLQFDNEDKSIVALTVNGMCFYKNQNNKHLSIRFGSCNKTVTEYSHQKYEQLYIVPKSGYYKVELWGASGGKSANLQDRSSYAGGAYTSGYIKLKKNQILFLQVGSKGTDGQATEDDQLFTSFGYGSIGGTGGYNGGGNGYDDPEGDAGGGGGGATDVRLMSGKWNDFDALKSRIMVAAGGGGMSRYYIYEGNYYEKSGIAGAGGTTVGKNANAIEATSEDLSGKGATQTEGYQFGIGENGIICMSSLNGTGGGAGGYMGSRAGNCSSTDWIPTTGAGGGSSYASGCKDCLAIAQNSTKDKLNFTNQSIHYSKLTFKNIVMKAGDETMPSYQSDKEMTGNIGDGYARITYIGSEKNI